MLGANGWIAVTNAREAVSSHYEKYSMPRVSVIVPTKNEVANIVDCLDSLLKLNYPSYEIIIVDAGSQDNTSEVVSQYPVKVITEKKQTRAAGCNAGFRAASGDIVAFTDADCIIECDWLLKIVRSFDTSEVAVVGGRDLTPPLEGILQRSMGAIEEHWRTKRVRGNKAARAVKGCNSAYLKRVFNDLDGFDEDFIYAEEHELHHRILKKGYDIIFNPDIIVWHKRRSSLLKYLNQCYKAEIGSMQCILKKKLPMDTGHKLMITGLLSAILFSVISLFNKAFITVLIVFPLALLIYAISRSIIISKKLHNSDLIFPLTLVLLANHLARLTGMFIETVKVVSKSALMKLRNKLVKNRYSKRIY